jgi:hypothetical protein
LAFIWRRRGIKAVVHRETLSTRAAYDDERTVIGVLVSELRTRRRIRHPLQHRPPHGIANGRPAAHTCLGKFSICDLAACLLLTPCDALNNPQQTSAFLFGYGGAQSSCSASYAAPISAQFRRAGLALFNALLLLTSFERSFARPSPARTLTSAKLVTARRFFSAQIKNVVGS